MKLFLLKIKMFFCKLFCKNCSVITVKDKKPVKVTGLKKAKITTTKKKTTPKKTK